MTTIRIRKRANFTTVDNTCLRDESLSWRAKGLFCYLMSLPDDWKISRNEIRKHATEGRQAMDTAFKELIQAGYIHKEPNHENGRLNGWNYDVYEIPMEVNSVLPETSNTENSAVCDRALLKTKGQKTNITPDKPSANQGVMEPKGMGENAHTRETQEQAEELAEIWAEGNGGMVLHGDAELLEEFLENNELGVYYEALKGCMGWYFEALEDKEKGWKTRYKSIRQFLTKYDRVSGFLWDWYADRKEKDNEEYKLWANGYRASLDNDRRTVRAVGEGNLVDAYLAKARDLARTQPHRIGLLCPEDRLPDLPDDCLRLPTDMKFAERFYEAAGFGDRLELMNETLRKRK